MSKLDKLIVVVMSDIANGKYGKAGDRFITMREMTVQKQISLKSAFTLFGRLKDAGAIEKERKWYIIKSINSTKNTTRKTPPLIGCIVTSLSSPFFAKLACFLEEAVHDFGANLLLASSEYDFAREQDRIESFVKTGVSGLFLCPWADAASEDYYKNLPVPAVAIGHRLERVEMDTVMVDNLRAARAVANHLLDRGCEDFAYIGQRGIHADERLFGFRAELLSRGVTLENRNILWTEYHHPDTCDRDIVELLSSRNRKRKLGLFCYHDLFASRVMLFCHKMGVRVPRDVSIVGFDDLPAAAEISPPLTTVRYPIEAMARIATETLYASVRLRDVAAPVCRYLDSELIIRKST